MIKAIKQTCSKQKITYQGVIEPPVRQTAERPARKFFERSCHNDKFLLMVSITQSFQFISWDMLCIDQLDDLSNNKESCTFQRNGSKKMEGVDRGK